LDKYLKSFPGQNKNSTPQKFYREFSGQNKKIKLRKQTLEEKRKEDNKIKSVKMTLK